VRDTGIAARQALRMRRFMMSVLTYVACGAIAQAYARLGFLPRWIPAWWALGALVVTSAVFIMLRTGWNLRFKDPSMTEIQLIFAMFAAMALISQADEARGAFLMFLPVPLLFGILRLNFRQMARVGVVGLLGYLAIIATIALRQPERVQPALETLNLIDLDNFKQVNDRFGHPVGDEVLVQVGKCLRDSIRTLDYVARIGGEEFAVLLSVDLHDQALAVSDRIRVAIEQLRIPFLQGLTISASIGIAQWAKAESSTSLIARADHALYRAKAQGRNRICCAEDARPQASAVTTLSDGFGQSAIAES